MLFPLCVNSFFFAIRTGFSQANLNKTLMLFQKQVRKNKPIIRIVSMTYASREKRWSCEQKIETKQNSPIM